MAMTPATSRTLLLPEYNGATLGLSWPLIWPAKDPGETVDYSLNIGGWLQEIQDTVATLNVSWSPNDLSVLTASARNGILTVVVSGGVAYQTYEVTFTVTSTLYNETLTRTVQLPVEPRYSAFGNAASGTVSGTVS